ncbi:MAG: TraB/GumN family protein [Chitinophagaceae bacterium]|nr:TraB/GumN family protein [Chitinophagaceae bacterium]
MKKTLFLTPLMLFITACIAQQQPLEYNTDKNSLLWEVSGNGLEKSSYLFGTFHMLCKDDINFSNTFNEALKRSDVVYMEMDMDDPATMLGGMMYMTMKDGKKLKDFYTEEEYKRLEDYFNKTLKMPLTMFQTMKPYFLVAFFYPSYMDCDAPSGVEQEIITLCKEYNKEIKGLETIQFQASIFDSIPYEWQAKELLNNIDSADAMKAEFASMVKLYKNQNLDSLAAYINKSDFSEEQYGKVLLTDRNKNWADQLNKLMRKESLFVAVGAGHLPGKTGVISLLKEMGYTVKPLENKKSTQKSEVAILQSTLN